MRPELTVLALLLLALHDPVQAARDPAGVPSLQATPLRRAQGPETRARARRVVDADGRLHWDYTVLGRGGRGGGTAGARPLPGPHKALVNTFDNTVTNGFFSVGGPGTEWVDWARKGAGRTGVVGAFAFKYGTDAPDLSVLFGPGATLGLSFYSGTTGFCARGTRAETVGGTDAFYDFSSLPGATGSQVAIVSVTAVLDPSEVFCLPDGKIGWSYVFLEPPLGTALPRSTGPFLTDLTSNTCWTDAFDLWSSPDPMASCFGTFSFGPCVPPTTFGVLPPCSGLWIQVFEEVGAPGSSAIFNATTTPNPVRYAETRAANLGEPWETSVTLAPNPAGAEVAGLVRFGLPGTVIPGNGVGLAFLVDGSRLLLAGSAANLVASGPGNPKVAVVAIPKDVSLLGSTWNTQGFAVLLSPVRLQALNGITITVGIQ